MVAVSTIKPLPIENFEPPPEPRHANELKPGKDMFDLIVAP